MKRGITFAVLLAIICLGFSTITGIAGQSCTTMDQAVGFSTEKGLDDFLSAARAAASDASKGSNLKNLLQRLMSENDAFNLKGGTAVEVLQRTKSEDPSMGKVKVRSTKNRRVFWVPAGALDCR